MTAGSLREDEAVLFESNPMGEVAQYPEQILFCENKNVNCFIAVV